MTLLFLFVAFAFATGIFGVFAFNLYKGAIGLINKRYWLQVPVEQRWTYCRMMALGTMLMGIGFLLGCVSILLTVGMMENIRAIWAFVGVLLGTLPGILLLVGTQKKFGTMPLPVSGKKKKGSRPNSKKR